jgi:hypothetical protein
VNFDLDIQVYSAAQVILTSSLFALLILVSEVAVVLSTQA